MGALLICSLFLLALSVASASGVSYTPIPILKQVNKQNQDGSYSFGYESGDGSYKIETKYPNGEIAGKYGYVDDQGRIREIEYGASKRGFEPVGEGITVPPPVEQNDLPRGQHPSDYEDDGQYREDPSIYYKSEKPQTPSSPLYNQYPKPVASVRQKQQFVSQYVNPDVNGGHPATNYDPRTGSYTISYTG